MQQHFGKLIFGLFCVGCHGQDGRGSGPVAEALGIPLKDLTLLSRENGGTFPGDEIREAIEGSSPLRGHRVLAMAPWAEVFADEFEDFAATMAVDGLVARRIDHLIAYLESIQR